MLGKDYWEDRYRNNDTGWDVGTITTPIKEYVDQLGNKSLRILIPGAGNSYEAEYLVKNGFINVFVLDIAKAPMENLLKRIPEIGESHLLHEDFFKLTGQFDLIIEQTFFCALDPQLRTAYAKQMNNLLKPGGKLVGLLFDDELNKDKPPFGGSKEEYLKYFKPYFDFKTFEKATNSIGPRAGRELFVNLVKKRLE